MGFRVVGRHRHQPRVLLADQHHLELAGDRARDVFLQLEHVGEIAVVGPRPQIGIVGDLDQLRGDTHLVALLAHRAFEDVGDAERVADRTQVFVPVLVPE